MFLGLMRIRGMECRTRYAEAFHIGKTVLDFGRATARPANLHLAEERPAASSTNGHRQPIPTP